ncbi:cytochrome P450 [Delphinella strobiligena]|nr:cytochrome P450 [Delphinella strobiligena]
MKANDCEQSYRCYPAKDLVAGSDIMYHVIKAAKQKRLLNYQHRRTRKCKGCSLTNFSDWSVAHARQSFKSAMGGAMFMVDGPEWSHSRSLIRPIFTKEQLANLDLLENHVQSLLNLLPGDGSAIDLQPLFHRFALDASTEFVFGESLHTLDPSQSDAQARLHNDFELVVEDAIDRVRYWKLYPLLKRKGADAAIQNVHEKAEEYSRKAVLRNENTDKNEKGNEADQTNDSYSFLDDYARQSADTEKMKYEAVSLLIAGRDTTASLLSHMFYLFARHPSVWEELVAEVDQLQGELPTYDWIKGAKYLRYCEHEAMRVYPAIPQSPPRVANKNTVLPLGGGPDGKSPLFVPRAANLILGDDAESFVPRRWENLRPGWNYVPFGGGPRNCVGQQFALTEIYYVTVRLVQHFRRIESRDNKEWQEKFSTMLYSEKSLSRLMVFCDDQAAKIQMIRNESNTGCHVDLRHCVRPARQRGRGAIST